MKIPVLLCVIYCSLFGLPEMVYGQVVINEFSATTSTDDRIELFNSGDQVITIAGWYLIDEAGNRKELDNTICPRGYRSFDYSNKLNNSGDMFYLYQNDNTLVDKVIYFDTYIPSHLAGQSTGRVPDGSSSWQIITSPNFQNSACEPSPTPSPTSNPTATQGPTNTPLPTATLKPSATPTPIPPTTTPTPTSSAKATYKINDVKNSGGTLLSSVAIYVDGKYVHHYAPEELTFCTNCECYSGVACGLGEHTVRLEKTGYLSWSEKKDFTAGLTVSVDPIMTAETTPTITITPTATKSPTPSPTLRFSPTPSPIVNPSSLPMETVIETSPEPSLSPTVLGVTSDTPPKAKPPLIAFGIIGGGVVFLGLGAFSFMKGRNIISN